MGKGSREPKRLDCWRSESAAERQGGPNPHMLREMVQECSSSPRPRLCPLHPNSCGCSSLSFSSRNGRFLELCLVASARGLQRQPKLRYWPMGAQGQATEPTQELISGPKHPLAHWVMQPATTPHWTSSSLSVQ